MTLWLFKIGKPQTIIGSNDVISKIINTNFCSIKVIVIRNNETRNSPAEIHT